MRHVTHFRGGIEVGGRTVSVSTVAREIGMSARRVREWCELGAIPTLPRPHGARGHWRIPASWLDAHREALKSSDRNESAEPAEPATSSERTIARRVG